MKVALFFVDKCFPSNFDEKTLDLLMRVDCEGKRASTMCSAYFLSNFWIGFEKSRAPTGIKPLGIEAE